MWLKATGFDADVGNVALLPGRDGAIERVLLISDQQLNVWIWAHLSTNLPRGRYVIDESLEPRVADDAALGWALGHYKFSRYNDEEKRPCALVWPENCNQDAVSRAYEAIALGRDLINTPANDMGPQDLAAAAKALASKHSGKVKIISGQALQKENFPAIYAVGQASSREPCLIDVTWGLRSAPKLTLVGKGVCFDTGGLDLKTADGMRLMKKDMGGAASVMALADMVMGAQLNVRLRMLVPAVENSVAGNAYRPQDVLQTRAGLTVEVGNTDAEGRLILCDALTEASEESPDLLIDFATLTGAARVALGSELPAFFTTDDEVAAALSEAGNKISDPMWRLPLFEEYRRHLDSYIADLCNMSKVGYGGAITAALFLREFVDEGIPWVHIDTMGWTDEGSPGRPYGGEVMGVRACFEMLRQRYT